MAQLQSLAFAPGTLREYETIYILRPDTVSDKIAEINNRVRGIIESGEGKVLRVDNWGRRRLSYEIKKQLKGVYLYWQYLGSPEIVAEIERNLRMIDSVIRYMTVRLADDVDPESRASDLDDEAFERAAITATDDTEEEAEEAEAEGAEEGEGEAEGEAEEKAEGESEEKAEGESEEKAEGESADESEEKEEEE